MQLDRPCAYVAWLTADCCSAVGHHHALCRTPPPGCWCADCWLLLCPSPDSQASVNGHIKVAELLLGAGADPCLANKEGRTAVDMAKTPELAQQLQAHKGSS